MSTVNVTNLKHPSSTVNNIVLASDGTCSVNGSPKWYTSSVASMSGTTTTITGINTDADQILMTIENASLTTNNDLIFRVGTSGGIVTSGYHVAGGYYSTGVSSSNRTTGFYTHSTGVASTYWNGFWILYRIAGNRYYGMLHIVNEGGNTVHYAEGNIDCPARIDRIQALGAGGSWDAGQMVVRYMVP